MKAIRFHEFGASEVLRYEDVDRPVPAPEQVLVQVEATSFNPVDDHIRAGHLAEMIPIALPYVPGIDLAGTVVELGADVTSWAVGDRVVAMLPLDSAGGAAEFALVPVESLATAPQTIELVDAAALPLTGLAAWQLAFELAELKPGQTVLVNGAAGAVGSLLVQLAVDAGAQVTAVDAPEHAGPAPRLRRGPGRRPPRPRRRSERGGWSVPGRGRPRAGLPRGARTADELCRRRRDRHKLGRPDSRGHCPRCPQREPVGPQRRSAADELPSPSRAGKLHLHIAERRPVAEWPTCTGRRTGRLTGKTVLLAP